VIEYEFFIEFFIQDNVKTSSTEMCEDASRRGWD
jgi:hypothetical protein